VTWWCTRVPRSVQAVCLARAWS